MEEGNKQSVWERTNVTNLLRNRESGNYYARVKIGNTQKWRTLKTSVFSVAKLRLGDVEKEMRSRGPGNTQDSEATGTGEVQVSRFFAMLREHIERDTDLAPSTKVRRRGAIKTLEATWPDLSGRDVRRVTVTDCQTWAARIRTKGTGSARSKGRGISASAFNKIVDELRAVFEIAVSQGIIYRNPASAVGKTAQKQKRLTLPSASQFAAIVEKITGNGTRWAKGCADLVRLLAYSGVRVAEARALNWGHVDFAKNELIVPGTKSESSARTIPLFPSLAQLLRALKAQRVDIDASRPILQVFSGLDSLESACAAVGVPKLTHHDMRHLFATRCIESGVDIPTVSRWLGHSDGGALAMKTYGQPTTQGHISYSKS